MTAISSTSIEANNKSYIKEYSWSGFKFGIKYSSYLYLGATVASLFISLAVVPIFPFTLLISNPVAWAVLGVVFIVLSGIVMSIVKPLFHWAKDSINQKKIEVKSPSSLLSNVKVSQQKLLLSSDNFISATIQGNYEKWLLSDEVTDIANKKYGYQDKDNGVMFMTVPLCNTEVPDSSIQILYECSFHWYIKERLNRPICTVILGLKDHWVTLVVDYDSTSKRFRAYYCNPFGGTYNSIDKELLKCLEEGKFFSLREKDIRVSKTIQQKDGCNCGIYALENAKIITDMMKEGRSFDDIDKKLAGYVYTDQKQEKKRLQEKREEFARVLINDMSCMDDSEFKQRIIRYQRNQRRRAIKEKHVDTF